MAKITSISCDLETYSSVDLSKCGVYKYAQADDFEILLFGYSVDGGPVAVIDLAQGEEVPEEILHALTDETVTKWAWNTSFERVCLSTWLRKHYPYDFSGCGDPDDTTSGYLDPASWKCTMTWAACLGLPLSLDAAGNALHLTEQKIGEGKTLVRFFSVPRKPTKNNPAARNYPADAPDRWQTFKEYNKRDVEVEMQIQQRIAKFPMPEFVWEEYHLSEQINDRGIAIDMGLVRQAILFNAISREQLTAAMRGLTGLENPNSVQQKKQWLMENDMEMESLGKKEVAQVLQTAPEPLKCHCASSLRNHRSKNMPPCRTLSARTAGPGGCLCSTEPTGPGGSLGASYNCKNCLRTTWQIWSRRGGL